MHINCVFLYVSMKWDAIMHFVSILIKEKIISQFRGQKFLERKICIYVNDFRLVVIFVMPRIMA